MNADLARALLGMEIIQPTSTPIPEDAPRGGLIPPPDHGGLPESFPWPASTLAPAPDREDPQ